MGKTRIIKQIDNYCTVYRAALNKNHVDSERKKFTAQAFKLRAAKNEEYISVELSAFTTPSNMHNSFKECHGVAILSVSAIRSLNLKKPLNVLHYPTKQRPGHCGITGLPSSYDNLNAERCAFELQRISNWVEYDPVVSQNKMLQP